MEVNPEAAGTAAEIERRKRSRGFGIDLRRPPPGVRSFRGIAVNILFGSTGSLGSKPS